MDAFERYQYWKNKADTLSSARLDEIKNDKEIIDELFSTHISFGTAGIRGVMDVGINRINTYTVSVATQALAEYIKGYGSDYAQRGVCIAYDNRCNSEEFALKAALILCNNGIKTYLFDSLRPTPELSYTILRLHAAAGINITASHNTKEYNGYKVYWEDGAQISPETAEIIARKIENIDEMNVSQMTEETAQSSGLLVYLGSKDDESYIKEVLSQSITDKYIKTTASTLKIVYTPFHGTGCRIVPEILKRAGFENVFFVKEQMINDPAFSTVKSPNPENTEGFALAIQYAEKNSADIIIGTDPDADRLGVCFKHNGQYCALSGNQIGVLLLDYIITERFVNKTMPPNPAVVKSIVSTNLARAICECNNINIFDVLTGFKFIGEKIKEFEASKEYNYIFGFEESNGYLPGTYARDKDAPAACLLVAEMACKYKYENIDLLDKLDELCSRYGFYEEKVLSKSFEGINAHDNMAAVCENLRNNIPKDIAGYEVEAVRDYKTSEIKYYDGKTVSTGLPSSDVIYFELSDGSSFVVRPSGTEPKIKIYLMMKAQTKDELKEKEKRFTEYSHERIFN